MFFEQENFGYFYAAQCYWYEKVNHHLDLLYYLFTKFVEEDNEDYDDNGQEEETDIIAKLIRWYPLVKTKWFT